MKKTYQAPCVEVNEISATQMICESLGVKGSFDADTQQKLGKDRGDYEPAEDADNFGDLW